MSEPKPAPDSTGTGAAPDARRIFSYAAAGKTRWADPVAAFRRLKQAAGDSDLYLLISTAFADDPAPAAEGESPESAAARAASSFAAQSNAWQKLVTIGCKTFNLQLLDEDTGIGCTEDEACEVLLRFVEWFTEKKSTESSSPTSSPTTPDSTPPPPSDSPRAAS